MTDPWIGAQLGHYRVEEFVGRGGMGVVYRAVHEGLGRTVALKLLAPELAQNQEFRDRFVRESRLAAGIDHPNVIPIYEADEIGGTYFIAMRFVDGVDLREALGSQGALPPERALSVVAQVAGALDAAHARGLVHRDVKPGNVLMVRDSDHCYLTDFGLTKAIASSTAFTATGQFVGTTDYVAPEQIEGKPLDRRTDVYALGCVLYECLTGAPPFKRESDMAVMYAHVQESPPTVTERRPDLPSGVDGVVATALSKSKDGRYPTCSALAGATQAALGGAAAAESRTVPRPGVAGATPAQSAAMTRPEPVQATPPPGQPMQPQPPPVSYPAPAYAPPTPVPGGGRSRPVTAIALIVAAVLLAAGGTAAALIATGGDDPAPVANTQATTGDTAEGANTTPESTTPDDGPTKTVPEEPPAGDGAGDEQAVVAAVEGHWAAIESHDFAAAWEFFGPPYTNQNTRAGWIAQHEDEGIGDISLTMEGARVSGDSATATIASLRTNAEKTGCKDWTGYYELTRIGGDWKIGGSELDSSVC